MPKPRQETVHLRMSDSEFEALDRAAQQCGARSISEFIRTAVHSALASTGIQNHLGNLERKIIALEQLAEAAGDRR